MLCATHLILVQIGLYPTSTSDYGLTRPASCHQASTAAVRADSHAAAEASLGATVRELKATLTALHAPANLTPADALRVHAAESDACVQRLQGELANVKDRLQEAAAQANSRHLPACLKSKQGPAHCLNISLDKV